MNQMNSLFNYHIGFHQDWLEFYPGVLDYYELVADEFFDEYSLNYQKGWILDPFMTGV